MLRTVLLCGALALAFPSLAAAQTGAAAPSTSEYLRQAGAGDQFEVRSGQLAQQRGSSSVRRMGAMMVRDHTRSTEMVMAAAHKSGMNPSPPPMSDEQEAMLSDLGGKSGDAFDRAYMADQMMAHEKALALHHAYAMNGEDRNLRATAGEIVPVVQRHLGMLHEMSGTSAVPQGEY